jgi:hypothetical protein
VATAVTLELDRDLPAALELGVELGAGVADRLPGQGGRAEPQEPATLVGQDQAVPAGRPFGVGFGEAEDRVEGQLGGAPDDLGGLPGVVDAGQLHDHPPVSRALQSRLGHAQLVDTPTQHLQSAGQGVPVDPPIRTLLGFQDDLGAAAQVQAEPGRVGDHHPAGRAHQQQDGNQTPPKVTRQDEPPASAHAAQKAARDGDQAVWRRGGARGPRGAESTSDRAGAELDRRRLAGTP